MKKQFLNELEKEAPFSETLKLQVLRKSKERSRAKRSLLWLTSGAVIVSSF